MMRAVTECYLKYKIVKLKKEEILMFSLKI